MIFPARPASGQKSPSQVNNKSKRRNKLRDGDDYENKNGFGELHPSSYPYPSCEASAICAELGVEGMSDW